MTNSIVAAGQDSIQLQGTTSTLSTAAMDRDAILASGDTFHEYDSQIALSDKKGCRAVKCLYKTNSKTGVVAGKNSYVYIPDSITEESIGENIDALLPYFISYLQEKEDSIVKDLHKSGAVTVYPTNVGMEKVIALLEASGEGSRLNKEKIESWFDAEIAELLLAAFSEKTGLPADSEKVITVVSVYRTKFASLASPKVHMRKEECETLQKALEVVGMNDSGIGAKFMGRLERMKVADSELLLAL